MAKLGRPDTEFDLNEVRRLAEKGHTQQDIAYILGVHPDTISRQKKKDPELSKAIAEGKAADKDSLLDKMKKLTEGGNNKYNATKYLLSALHGISETSKVDMTTDGEKIEATTFVMYGKEDKD